MWEGKKASQKAFLSDTTQDRHVMPGDLATVRDVPIVSSGGYISFVLVSCYCNKIPALINLKIETVYLGSQFWK